MTADALRWAAAVHETGHAIVGCELGRALVSLSISETNDGSGRTDFHPDDVVELADLLAIWLAGWEATDILGLKVHGSMDALDLGELAALELDGHIRPENSRRLREEARSRARSIIEARRPQLIAGATALGAAGYLDAQAFLRAMS